MARYSTAGTVGPSKDNWRPPSRAATATSFSTRPVSRFSNRPGTARPSTDKDDGDWVVSILEGRGTGKEVGVAALERNHLQVMITQFTDTATCVKTLHLLTTRPPSIILIPSTFLSGGKNKSGVDLEDSEDEGAGGGGGDHEISLLIRSIQDAWRDVPIIPVQRKYWVESKGFEFISQLIVQDDQRTATLLSSKNKYYALSALCALFKYLEASHRLSFSPRSLRITYCALEGTCLVDTDTAVNLELVANVTNKNSKQHLLGLVNHCYTPMATRLLRTNILGPLADVGTIDIRLNAVEEMVGSEELFHSIRKGLEGLRKIDVDKLIGQIVTSKPHSLSSSADPSHSAESKILRVLTLRTILLSLAPLRTALENTDAELLRSIHLILKDERTDEMLEEIGKTVNEDAVSTFGQKGSGKGARGAGGGGNASGAPGRNARIYAVRSEKKLLLNVARETYKENVQDTFDLCEQLKEKHKIDISLNYSASGYTFMCLANALEEKQLPKSFINVTRTGKKIEFSSLDLKKRNARLTESVQEIFVLSDEIMDELLAEIRGGIACLYRCSEAIAMLDMLASFADVATKYNYVRPEFTEVLAIKNGRHPLHERFRMSDGSFVPNDTYANDEASFQLISGANMSGKSTLLRQIALLQVLAQIGCYVPADYASFRCIDTLLSRLSNDDNLAESMSTFSQEMSTMAMICSVIQTPNTRCLIIVDELGRGTSPLEGIGIAHALSEVIIKSKAICFFATHFKELSRTLGYFPNVVSLHLDTTIDPAHDYRLTFHHRCIDGPSKLTHYGLELAKAVKLPPRVIADATRVSYALEELAAEGHKKSQTTKLNFRRQELLRLRTMLKMRMQGKPELMDPQQIIKDLRAQQEETIQVLAAMMEAISLTSKSDANDATSNEQQGTDTHSQTLGQVGDYSSPLKWSDGEEDPERMESDLIEGEKIKVDIKPIVAKESQSSFESLSFSQVSQ